MENRDKDRISWDVDRDEVTKEILLNLQAQVLAAKMNFKTMLEAAYPSGALVLVKLRENSNTLTPATCHGFYSIVDGGKITVWLYNHVGIDKHKRKIHYGHIYRVRKDDKGT